MPVWSDGQRDEEMDDFGRKIPDAPSCKKLLEYVSESYVFEFVDHYLNEYESFLSKMGYLFNEDAKSDLGVLVVDSLITWGDPKFELKPVYTDTYVRPTLFTKIKQKLKRVRFHYNDNLMTRIFVDIESSAYREINSWYNSEYKVYDNYKSKLLYSAQRKISDLIKRRRDEIYPASASSPLSDARLKHNVTPIIDALSRVIGLRGVEYEWKEEMSNNSINFPTIGLIAQELEEKEPALVFTDDSGFKGIHYGNMVALLIEAVKEQNASIKILEEKVSIQGKE